MSGPLTKRRFVRWHGCQADRGEDGDEAAGPSAGPVSRQDQRGAVLVLERGLGCVRAGKARDEAPGTAKREDPWPGSSAYHPPPHTQGIARAMRTGPWTLAMAGVAVCGLSLLSLGLKRWHLSPRTWGGSI